MWPSATHEFCPGCKQDGSALRDLQRLQVNCVVVLAGFGGRYGYGGGGRYGGSAMRWFGDASEGIDNFEKIILTGVATVEQPIILTS